MDFQFALIDKTKDMDEWHEGLRVVYILTGRGFLTGDIGRHSSPVQADDIFVVNPYRLNWLKMEEGGRALILTINKTFLSALCPEIFCTEIICRSNVSSKGEMDKYNLIRKDLAELFQIAYKNEETRAIQQRTKLAILVRNLVIWFGVHGDKDILMQENPLDRLQAVAKYVHDNFRNKILLSEVADHINLSPSSLSHLFRRLLNRTFTDYLNDVRLSHGESLLSSNRTITEIAYDVGFANTNAFINAFKQKNNITPGHYRNELQMKTVKSGEQTPASGDSLNLYDGLLAYLSFETYGTNEELPREQEKKVNLRVDAGKKGQGLRHTWKELINLGYAKDLQNVYIQKQLKQLQKEIGFRYGRIKGLLDDDMLFFSIDFQGKPQYNYVFIDEVIDFILSMDMLPFIEIGNMPSAIAETQVHIFKRPAIFAIPSNLGMWLGAVENLMIHLMERYGAEAVRTWMFCPFFTAEYGHIFSLDMDKYWTVYRSTTQKLRDIDSQIVLAGPSYCIEQVEKIESFLEDARNNNYLPDILSLRVYYALPKHESEGMSLFAVTEGAFTVVSGNEQHLKDCLNVLMMKLDSLGFDMPVLLDEWSNSSWQRDLCNDTSYKSAFILKEILNNYDCFEGMGFWTFSDNILELPPSNQIFHGGFGLFTRSGLPKSGFRAMQLLANMGDRLLDKGDGYFISASEGKIQIFLYNYTHYDTLYRFRHTTNLTHTDRYKVFNKSNTKYYSISISNLTPGTYVEKRYSIGPDGGSVYDEWLMIGAPDQVDEFEFEYLLRHSHPIFVKKENSVSDQLNIDAALVPHEIQLITVERK